MIAWFACWLFGHEPASETSDMFGLMDLLVGEEVSYITYCRRCNSMLTYDEKNKGWVKW